jgi:hypothetical protein
MLFLLSLILSFVTAKTDICLQSCSLYSKEEVVRFGRNITSGYCGCGGWGQIIRSYPPHLPHPLVNPQIM